ncbi:DUF2778 domain-containing protein [Labrenzia sp. DG1229]|uniref:DUF2778 domain-containing protein n=1 Tax=Labrenzia sp. DG1229 TaxID=681847 RepID=UPI0006910DF0|nr:DUF2778 domain-containing protein [Labrenzia sp. DG1229]
MQQNRNQTDRTGRKRVHRVFHVLIAGMAIVLGGLIASVTLFDAPRTPSRDAATHAAGDSQFFASVTFNVEAARVGTSQGVDDQAGNEQPLIRSATEDLGSALPQFTREKEAKSAAKRKLAEKLARLNLALSLTERRTERNEIETASGVSGSRLAERTTAVAEEETMVTGSLPSPRAIAKDDVSGTGETLAETEKPSNAAEAELEVTAAISHPVPGSKPAPPVKTARTAVGGESQKRQTPAPVLAYATPGTPETENNGAFGGIGKLFSGLKGGLPGRGRGVAVYDISAAIVHMPDGTKLEAHSGIGHRKDNPKYAHVRNLGPTPPNIYDLRMRERRFHGVEAIRMTPHDNAAMKGRDGMLAHTPLLRRSNGSHGCVAFKDYNKFLKAFKAGKVKKIIVVPSMDKLPKYMAALNKGAGA